jgi:DNA-binding CsgD family transcriptional regulator
LITYHRALIAYAQGDMSKAVALWESTLATGQLLDRPQLVAWSLMRHALLASEQRDLARAAQMIREFLKLGPPSAYRYMSSALMTTSAALAEASGEPNQAARLLGASATATETSDQGFVLLQPSVDALVRRVRDAVGSEAFDRYHAEGRMMRPAETAAEISAVLDAGEAWEAPAETASAAPFGLTIREVEVMRLLVAGRTDQQIADALFVSRRTVNTHVGNIFAKLGVANRTEAVSVAIRHGLA